MVAVSIGANNVETNYTQTHKDTYQFSAITLPLSRVLIGAHMAMLEHVESDGEGPKVRVRGGQDRGVEPIAYYSMLPCALKGGCTVKYVCNVKLLLFF